MFSQRDRDQTDKIKPSYIAGNTTSTSNIPVGAPKGVSSLL